MVIATATIAEYAPWGNAQLAFEVVTGTSSTDATTGNTVPTTEIVEYLAAVNLQPPKWQADKGVDVTTYFVRGRLLTPAVLDSRITNGSQASATVNGYRGRFELVVNLSMEQNHRDDLRQEIEGIFRVIGGPN